MCEIWLPCYCWHPAKSLGGDLISDLLIRTLLVIINHLLLLYVMLADVATLCRYLHEFYNLLDFRRSSKVEEKYTMQWTSTSTTDLQHHSQLHYHLGHRNLCMCMVNSLVNGHFGLQPCHAFHAFSIMIIIFLLSLNNNANLNWPDTQWNESQMKA